MLRLQLPPYDDIINFGCILDLLEQAPVITSEMQAKEKIDKYIAREQYNNSLCGACDLHEVTEIIYEMLDIGLYPTPHTLKLLLTKLIRLDQTSYATRLFDLLRANNLVSADLNNLILRAYKVEYNNPGLMTLVNEARANHYVNAETYTKLLHIFSKDRANKTGLAMSLLDEARKQKMDTPSVYAHALAVLQNRSRSAVNVHTAISVFETAKEAKKLNAMVVNRMLTIILRCNVDFFDKAQEIYLNACLTGRTDERTEAIYIKITKKFAPEKCPVQVNKESNATQSDSCTKPDEEPETPPMNRPKKGAGCCFGMFKQAAAKLLTKSAAAAGLIITFNP